MIRALIVIYSILAFLDLLSLFYLSGSVPISVFIVSQLVSGLTGLILLKRKDVNVIYFVENQLKNRAPVIREIWFEFMLVIGYLALSLPGYISDIIGILLLLRKTQVLIYQKFSDLINH